MSAKIRKEAVARLESANKPGKPPEGGTKAGVGGRNRVAASACKAVPTVTATSVGEYEGADKELVAAVSRNCSTLRKGFRTWPDDWLIELFDKHQGKGLISALHFQNAIDSVAELEQMAALGDQAAIGDLASLAVRISRFLSKLVGANDDAVQKKVDDGKLIHREIFADDIKADAHRLILKTQDGLMKLSKAAFEALESEFTKSRLGGPLMPGAIGMFRRENLRTPDEAATQEESIAPDVANTPEESITLEESITGDAKTVATETDGQVPLDPKKTDRQRDVDYLLASMFEERVRGLSREAVRRVLGGSYTWPIVMEVRTGGGAKAMEAQVAEAILVIGRDYRLPSPKAKSVEIRSIANSIFSELENERQRHVHLSAREKEKWKVIDQEEAEFRGRIRKDRTECTRGELDKWEPPRNWHRKAALLPPPNVVDLDQWVEAGMAYLESFVFRDIERGIIEKHPNAASNIGSTLMLASDGALCETCQDEREAFLNAMLVNEDGRKAGIPEVVRNECATCQELRAEKKREYEAWLTLNTRVRASALNGLDDGFDKYNWAGVFQIRAEKRSTPLRSVVKEKLKTWLKPNFNQK